jgi:hypothetical protein
LKREWDEEIIFSPLKRSFFDTAGLSSKQKPDVLAELATTVGKTRGRMSTPVLFL